jgi:N utilization substance protein B
VKDIKKHPRRKAREGVFQALYSLEISGESPEKVLDDIIERNTYSKEIREFVRDLYLKTLQNRDFIKGKISAHLKNWEFSRIALLDRILLEMGTCEIFFIDDVPPKVSIAEAIEIAKQFSTEDSSGFVNGLLDAIYKEQLLDNNNGS